MVICRPWTLQIKSETQLLVIEAGLFGLHNDVFLGAVRIPWSDQQRDGTCRYALTGFRNKASTDLEILGRALAAMFDSYHHESYCAVFDVGANIGVLLATMTLHRSYCTFALSNSSMQIQFLNNQKLVTWPVQPYRCDASLEKQDWCRTCWSRSSTRLVSFPNVSSSLIYESLMIPEIYLHLLALKVQHQPCFCFGQVASSQKTELTLKILKRFSWSIEFLTFVVPWKHEFGHSLEIYFYLNHFEK